MIGQTLGPYRVLDKLGEGGMGEVYRARDLTLARDVAIKVLPSSVANDPDRLARFGREAQIVASLNHPHIAQIYGLEDAGGTPAIVMELVEGPTLAERIAKGIDGREALVIGRQIAEALEAAHERGIVHRDLKPANIKVRPDGTVKVLDFGLAKALENPGGAATASAAGVPTKSIHGTQAGRILGTPAYMSPEQAAGTATDRRYLAYQSNESGGFQIYVRPFPDLERGKWQVSTHGGTRAAWARSGRELFFLDRSSAFVAVSVETSGETSGWGTPVRILDGFPEDGQINLRSYDVAPDGRRFLVLREAPASPTTTDPAHVVVVLNWTEELKVKLPVGRD